MIEQTSKTARRWADAFVFIVLGVLLTLGVLQILTPAQSSPFDGNGDRGIDRSEFRSFAASVFEQADSNGDGVIDPSEQSTLRVNLRPNLAQSITLMFRIIQVDAVRDGKIAKDELMNVDALASIFDSLDKNGDGILVRNESEELAFEFLFP